jgi:predicted acyltransferase
VKAPDEHLASIDAFRGIAVAGMILVNNPGNWNAVFESLTHADWNGCTVADLVFPFFIFVLGVVMPFSFTRRRDRGQADRDLYLRIMRRGVALIGLGLILNFAVPGTSLATLRFPGVLQRIGVVYVISALIVLNETRWWQQGAFLAIAILGEWLLLRFVPFDGAGPGLGPRHNLAGYIDKAVFGAHALTRTGDPEGILATLPAVGTALLGAFAGDWLLKAQSPRARVGGLAIGGLVTLAIGMIWARAFPLNKALWTGSFVAVTGGLAALTLAACDYPIDVRQSRGWARPFLWLGFNPLAIYFLSELVGHLFDQPGLRVTGRDTTLKTWLYWEALRPLLHNYLGEEWMSLTYGLLTVAFWTGVAGLLYRRGIRFQV